MRRLLVLSVALVIFAGCDSTPASQPKTGQAAAAPEKKEPSLYTASQCLGRMSDQALRWSRDALPFHVESMINQEANGQDGKATVWRASFASASLRKTRTFTCSGSRLPDEAPYGISSSAEMTMTSNDAAAMFDRHHVVVDSDAAYKTAQEHGGTALMKKNAKQDVMYALDFVPKDKQLVWYVLYGPTSDRKGVGVVDASTGKWVRGR
jgi:hypothetical protein